MSALQKNKSMQTSGSVVPERIEKAKKKFLNGTIENCRLFS